MNHSTVRDLVYVCRFLYNIEVVDDLNAHFIVVTTTIVRTALWYDIFVIFLLLLGIGNGQLIYFI